MLAKPLKRALICVLIGGSPLAAFVTCNRSPFFYPGGGVVVVTDGDDDDDFLEELGEDLCDDDDCFDDD